MKKIIFSTIILGALLLSQNAFSVPMQYTFEGEVNTVFTYGDPLPLSSGDSIQYVFILDVDAYTADFVSGPLSGDYGSTVIQEQGFNSSENGFEFFDNGNHLYVDVGVQGGHPDPVKDWDIGHWSMVADWNDAYSGSGFEGTVQLVDIRGVSVPAPTSLMLFAIGLFGWMVLNSARYKVNFKA
jgi:hypothetical protein